MTFIMGGAILVLCLQLCLASVMPTGEQKNAEKTLIASLLGANYNDIDRMSRPVEHLTDKVTVNIGLTLTSIESFDEASRILLVTGWLVMSWNDYQLTWNPNEHENLEKVIIPEDLIWKPDIVLYNRLGSASDSQQNVNIVAFSDGSVTWVPPTTLKLKCASLPNSKSTYKCDLKFGSWVLDGNKMDVTLQSDSIDMANFMADDHCEIINTTAVRHSVTYECCPEPYVDVTFGLTLRQRAHAHQDSVEDDDSKKVSKP